MLSEPSFIAVEARTSKVRAVWMDAKFLLDRGAESALPVRPVKHGVITDFELADEMLQRFFRKVYRSHRATLDQWS